jgi:hypothetical protein
MLFTILLIAAAGMLVPLVMLSIADRARPS